MESHFKEAVKWMRKIYGVNVEAMLQDGVLKKKDVIDNYNRYLERGEVNVVRS